MRIILKLLLGFCILFYVIGSTFQYFHWYGGSFMLFWSFCIGVILSLYIEYRYKPKQEKAGNKSKRYALRGNIINYLIVLSVISVLVGLLFKSMDWVGGHYILVIGGFGLWTITIVGYFARAMSKLNQE